MITCPHCQSKNINKSGMPPNGKKANGTQNYLCRSCGKQFQIEYKNQGANPIVKTYVERALCRNYGIRDIKEIFKVIKPYILNTLVNYAENLEIKPQKQHYKSLQIAECRPDEFWTYVCTKKIKNGFYTLIALKNKKLWLMFLEIDAGGVPLKNN
jgi:insertion element IS1 protein InsB